MNSVNADIGKRAAITIGRVNRKHPIIIDLIQYFHNCQSVTQCFAAIVFLSGIQQASRSPDRSATSIDRAQGRGQECTPMYIRQFVIAVLLWALQSCLASAGEPVVKGSFHTVFIFGSECLSVADTDSHLRPGTRLEMRSCQNSPDQLFEWNVVTFEIKFHNLCMDALRVGAEPSQPGDPVGLWYCQQTPHQKWFPHHKNESWLEAFNIVGGGSPSSELCLSIAGDKSVDGAQLTIQKCEGGDNQWFRLNSWPPLDGQSLSQRSNSISLKTFLATTAAQLQRQSPPESTGR